MALKNVEKALIVIIIWYPTLYLFRIGSVDIPSVLILMILFMSRRKVLSRSKIQGFPWKLSLSLCVLSYVLSNFITEDMPRNAVLLHYLTMYLLVYLEWCIYKGDKQTNDFFIRQFGLYMAILVFCGYLETITGNNFILQSLNFEGMADIMPMEENVRYGIHKAQSLTIWSEVYGMMCGFGLTTVLILVTHTHQKINSRLLFILVVLFLAVVFCGSRAVLVGVILCCMSGASFFVGNVKNLLALIIVSCLLLLINSDFTNQVILGLLHPDKVGGSNWEMREEQLETSIFFFLRHPIVGNGLYYVYNIIMDIDKASINGAESLLFEILIDRGCLGLLSLLVLIFQVGKFLCHKKASNLIFVMIGFLFAKMMTLMASLEEMFFLFYVIPFFHIQASTKMSPNIFKN